MHAISIHTQWDAAMEDSSSLDAKPAGEVAGDYTPGTQSRPAAPTFSPATEDERDRERRATLKQAMKIARTLGWMLACNYLMARGWSVEAAHQALAAGSPRKAKYSPT
jgi:hypothetical protein